MTIRKLGLAVIIASAIAATSAVFAYGVETPAGPRLNEGAIYLKAVPPRDTGKADPSHQQNNSTDRCHQAQWPYLPTECIRNASPEQLARLVRIIPIHVVAQRL